jgi:hypothetical protein
MPRNKNRIYMAFYSRSQNDNYHMAVLVSPKNPNPDDTNTWRLHVMNRPNPNRLTQQEWKYEPLQVIGRTGRLLSLALLDKTEKSGEEVSEMLRNVEVVQDDMSWNCKSWTFSAIKAIRLLVPPLSVLTDPQYLVSARPGNYQSTAHAAG